MLISFHMIRICATLLGSCSKMSAVLLVICMTSALMGTNKPGHKYVFISVGTFTCALNRGATHVGGICCQAFVTCSGLLQHAKCCRTQQHQTTSLLLSLSNFNISRMFAMHQQGDISACLPQDPSVLSTDQRRTAGVTH